ncbi:alpha/beta hydrolase family protein [Sphingomonas sp. CJ20]
MIHSVLLMFAALVQDVFVANAAQESPAEKSVRRAILPGKPDLQLKPIEGFSCRHFLGYSEDQTHFNMQTGDTACSGEVFADPAGSFRQVNYLPTPAGLLPVVIHSPRARIDATSRIVIYLNGGPRSPAVNRPLAKEMVAKGYTVLMPIYLGEIETLHPAPDLPGAIEQVRALSRWAGKRLVATVGVSTGGYLAAAACTVRCSPRILLAPLSTTPEDGLSAKWVDWHKLTDRSCLWQRNGPHRVCADQEPFFKSFWGKEYYRKSLTTLLRGQCDRVRIIVSPCDRRVYDPEAIDGLRAAGCAVETPAGHEHFMIDVAPALNARTLELIAQQEVRRQSTRM